MRGVGLVWADGTTAAAPSRASNRCPGCARVVAFEAVTMLRQDAEENSAPRHVLTLTSRGAVTSSGAYRVACASFWRAFRKRWGRVEYCGFVEWTTGKAVTSGGVRRLHSHWLVKGLDLAEGEYASAAEGSAPCTCRLRSRCVECWVAWEWRSLTGAWVVQVRELRHVGGVVGYLALHHEKMEQAPPKGWTGRRLRPSGGYFAVSGRVRRERARAWLRERRWELRGLDEGARLAEAARGAPRIVFGRTESERVASAVLEAMPDQSFLSLLNRRAYEERMLRSAALRAGEDEVERLARVWRESVRGEALRARRLRREDPTGTE